MNPGLIALVAAYALSQFTRACLAVLAPLLEADLGATAPDLAQASGAWFLTFAAMQLPVGWALDRIGPRRTASFLLVLGGAGGTALFAFAAAPWHITAAMALIGVGFSPVLMSSYFLFARTAAPERFATLAGVVVGLGTLGNVASATPLALAAGAFGWRPVLAALAVLILVLAALCALLLRDPPPVSRPSAAGGLWPLFAGPKLWPILAMMAVCYMPIAALRGLWIGPFYDKALGASLPEIGQITLLVGFAMVAGTFAFGPLERALGTRKYVILPANLIVGLLLLALAFAPPVPGLAMAALFIALGLFGSSFPLVIAHGRAFVPPHLIGRGVSMLNLFGIASVGLAQMATARLYAAFPPAPPAAPFQAVFLALGAVTLLGCLLYAFAEDRVD